MAFGVFDHASTDAREHARSRHREARRETLTQPHPSNEGAVLSAQCGVPAPVYSGRLLSLHVWLARVLYMLKCHPQLFPITRICSQRRSFTRRLPHNRACLK